jgi:hypothetical protein
VKDGRSTLNTIPLPVWLVIVACATGGRVGAVAVEGGTVVDVVACRVVEVGADADCFRVVSRPTHHATPIPASTRLPTRATAIGASERCGRPTRALEMLCSGRLVVLVVVADAGGPERDRDAACCSASSARCWCSTDSSGVGACRYQRRSAKTHSRANTTAMTTGIA